MIIKNGSDIRSSEITPRDVWISRREFFRSAAGLAAGLVAIDAAASDKLAVSKRVVTTTDALTPYSSVTTFNNFYEFGSDKADPARHSTNFKPKPWSVAVEGLCG